MSTKTKETSKPSSIFWLEQYIEKKSGNRYNILDPHYQAIISFSLIWNLFERTIFHRECTENDIWNEANNEPFIDPATIQDTYHYLHNRYVEDGSPNELFEKLGFKRHNKQGNPVISKHLKDLVKYLCGAANLQEMNCVCLMLAKRYRNNLFHGNKDLASIWNEDQELFEIICQYLISYLDYYQEE